MLLIYVGLRKGEALGLRWCDVDLPQIEKREDAGLLRVRQSLNRVNREFVFSSTKTDKSRRDITLPPDAVAALRQWRADQLKERVKRVKLGADWQDSGLVFTNELGLPIGPEHVNRALKTLLKAAKLPHLRVHDLRHACATLLLAEGVDLKTISTILGHSTIATTADVYAHVNQQLIADAMHKLNRAIGR